MRRNNRLALHMLDAPDDNISHLIGADKDRERRKSAQNTPNSHEQIHRRLPRLFSHESETSTDDEGEVDDAGTTISMNPKAARSLSGLRSRLDSYSRTMREHTKAQVRRPAIGTVHSYTKTMHAFTSNQMSSARATRRDTSSTGAEASQAVPPAQLYGGLSKLNISRDAGTSANSPPDCRQREKVVHDVDLRRLKRRSVTEPTSISRDFATSKAKDLAAN